MILDVGFTYEVSDYLVVHTGPELTLTGLRTTRTANQDVGVGVKTTRTANQDVGVDVKTTRTASQNVGVGVKWAWVALQRHLH